MTMNLRRFVHSFEPIINSESKILILGSVPSVASVAKGFHYMHPQNRFWKLLSALLSADFLNADAQEKRALLLQNKVALYEAIVKCEIYGSSDSKVKNIVPVYLEKLIANTNIKKIFCNGTLAYKTALKYNFTLADKIISLPSTSSANASYDFEKLKNSWKIILEELKSR